MQEAPPYIADSFLALVVVLFALAVYAVGELSRRAHISTAIGAPPGVAAAAVLVVWLGFTAAVSLTGFFRDFSSLPPRIAVAIVPPLIAVLAVGFSPFAARLLTVCPPSWLIGVQTFRIIMELMLWMLVVNNVIPVQMSFEGRNFDVLVGLTAPIIAYLCFVRRSAPAWVAVWWNVLGLALLGNIVTIAMLSTPSPFRVFMNEPANTLVATMPFIWLPAFVVPFALAAHVLSLRQLLTPAAAFVGNTSSS